MLKKIIIMVMGMICGVGLLLGWQEYQKKNEKVIPVNQSTQPKQPDELINVDFDAAYEAARRGEHWIDKQEKLMQESTEQGIKKMESEGDDAANTFKKYLEP